MVNARREGYRLKNRIIKIDDMDVNMMGTKVSIIVPCYNCEEYISETLGHLYQQTYKNIEIICVNDGSRDNTLALLNSWKNKGTINIKIINQENSGVSVARNRGIQESTGDYLMFCDADDCYHKSIVEFLVNGLEKNKTDTAYCLLSRDNKCLKESVESMQILIKSQAEFMRDLLYRMGEISFCCYLYKKEIIVRAGIYFDCNSKYFEDREFNWKYLANCKRAVLFNAPLYWYRRTGDSATTTKVTTWRTDSLDAAMRVEEYLQECKVPFVEELKTYLFQRVMFAVAKDYAVAGAYELLMRLDREYDVTSCMRVTAHDHDKKVAMASKAYLVSPRAFYTVIRLASKIL